MKKEEKSKYSQLRELWIWGREDGERIYPSREIALYTLGLLALTLKQNFLCWLLFYGLQSIWENLQPLQSGLSCIFLEVTPAALGVWPSGSWLRLTDLIW